MLTRTRLSPGRSLLLGLIAGLASCGAAAREEVIVYGAEAAAAQAQKAQLKVELGAYLEALNRQLKEQLDEDLKQRPAASVELALGKYLSRG